MRTAVNSATRGLELVDDFHGSHLGRAGKRAGRKASHQGVEAIDVRAQLSRQARREMHHVRIALDEHQPLHLHRAVLAHAAEIVAAQVDEHDVLGALLGIGEQFGLRAARSSFSSAAARTRASERPVERVASLDLHQHLGRTAHHGNIVELQKIQVRRRIHDAQRAINLERIGGRCSRRKALADHHLKNVARRECTSWLCARRPELRLASCWIRRAKARRCRVWRAALARAFRAFCGCGESRARRRRISRAGCLCPR